LEVTLEKHFQQLIDLLPAAVYICEAATGIITFFNAKAAEIWGRSPAPGETDQHFCNSLRLYRADGSTLPYPETPTALAFARGQAVQGQEMTVERADGSRVPTISNVDLLRDEQGRVVSAVHVFYDATSSRQADDARARLAAIVQSSDDAIISKDLNGIISSWNQGAERLFGYTPEEAIGQPVTMLMPPERHDEEPGILARVRRGERIDHYETVRRHKGGSLMDISLTVSPVLDSRGRIVGASKIARDITGQKQAAARAALDQEAMARLYEIGKRCVRPGDHFIENLHEMLNAALWITGADKGYVQIAGDVAGTLTVACQRGFDSKSLEALSAIGPGHRSASDAQASAERMVVEDVATSPVFAGPQAREALLAAGVRALQSTPLIGSTGEVLGMLSTHFRRPHLMVERQERLLDVLARQAADYIERKRNDALRDHLLHTAEAARADAENANRAKDEFLAMLGHELRNPLAAIRNAIAAAAIDASSRDRALSIAQRQTDQLGRIVDDLLDVARITRGRVPLRRKKVALANIVQRAVDGARGLMDERGHTLRLTLPSQPIYLDADPARIEQAIANILGNAAKYTEPGGQIAVSVAREDARAVIRVRDNGTGISPDMLARVFDLFQQGQRTLERSQGGLGIGLTLVRRIAELHGGTAEAHSEGLGRGSEFVLKLPALVDGTEPLVVQSPETARGRRDVRPARVLVVEDNPDAAESLVMILEMLGHHVRVAHDGQSAIAQAKANPPDVMLVDIGLPGMDGYEVARRIRHDASLRELILVALTGYGRPEDKARAMMAGFDYHLVKPVDLGALGELVGRLGRAI